MAVVRLLVFFFVLLCAYVAGGVAATLVLKHAPAAQKDAILLGGAMLLSLVMIAIYALLVRWFEKRSAKELAPLKGTPLLVAGAAIAFLMFCAVYGVMIAQGFTHFGGIAGYDHAARFAAMAVFSGVGEELIFRGAVYRIVEDSLGTLAAMVVSAALFGGLHLMNPHATIFSSVAIALEAGILLGAAYAATRNLWLAIGMHIGWNFTEGGVFGAAVSGGGGGHGIVNMPLSGPELMTGGAFGPEASVVTIGVCLLIAAVLLVMTVRRGRWVPLSFNMVLD